MAYDIILGRDDSDKTKFGKKGLIYLGKGFVTMGNYTSLSNNLYMDVVRSHVVLIAGKRGSGKCLHEDTLITLANGSQIPIKCLEKNKDKIISLNGKLKIEQKEKSEFFSRKTDRLLKIALRSGKEIKLTPEHPLLTIKGWKEAKNLEIGSRIATPREIPAFGNREMEENEIKLLSYLLAERHTKSIILFTNSDERIVNDFKDSLKAFDNTLELIKEKGYNYRISSPKWRNKILIKSYDRDSKGHFIKGIKQIYEKRSIRRLIEREKIFGLLTTQKSISQSIMELNKKNLSLFLNRLFSCDGSIYKSNNHWEISYSSSSEKMIRQIQSILLRFRILSKLRKKNIRLKGKEFKSFELFINEENSLRFINEIGFFGKKEERQLIASQEISQKKKNPNVDTIPKDIWELYKPKNWTEIGRQFGYRYPKAMSERINYSPSRQTLFQIAEIERSNPLMALATSDIFWDEVIKVELLEGDFKVYDLCVPENHNFIANDIIVHNSYTIGVMAEELSNLDSEVSQNISSLIFDTMGIFWTMKFKNEKETDLLRSWNMQPKQAKVEIYAPLGKTEDYKRRNIPIDHSLALKPSELEAEDWVLTFDLSIISQEGTLIQNVIRKLKKEYNEFFIEDIISEVEKDKNSSRDTKNIVLSLFNAAEGWGIFAGKNDIGTEISDLVKAGRTTILDLSVYSSIGSFNVRGLVIGLISRKLFEQRVDARKKEEIQSIQHGIDYLTYEQNRETPLVWLFVDEAHEFLPKDYKTPATDSLIQILREGRQPGISIVLATQQPGQIHKDVMTQSDIVLSHRVTAKPDIDALNQIMQTYLIESIKQKMDELPRLKGSAIILDDNSERIYPMRMRPRFTWHGGEAPTSVKAETER